MSATPPPTLAAACCLATLELLRGRLRVFGCAPRPDGAPFAVLSVDTGSIEFDAELLRLLLSTEVGAAAGVGPRGAAATTGSPPAVILHIAAPAKHFTRLVERHGPAVANLNHVGDADAFLAAVASSGAASSTGDDALAAAGVPRYFDLVLLPLWRRDVTWTQPGGADARLLATVLPLLRPATGVAVVVDVDPEHGVFTVAERLGGRYRRKLAIMPHLLPAAAAPAGGSTSGSAGSGSAGSGGAARRRSGEAAMVSVSHSSSTSVAVGRDRDGVASVTVSSSYATSAAVLMPGTAAARAAAASASVSSSTRRRQDLLEACLHAQAAVDAPCDVALERIDAAVDVSRVVRSPFSPNSLQTVSGLFDCEADVLAAKEAAVYTAIINQLTALSLYNCRKTAAGSLEVPVIVHAPLTAMVVVRCAGAAPASMRGADAGTAGERRADASAGTATASAGGGDGVDEGVGDGVAPDDGSEGMLSTLSRITSRATEAALSALGAVARSGGTGADSGSSGSSASVSPVHSGAATAAAGAADDGASPSLLSRIATFSTAAFSSTFGVGTSVASPVGKATPRGSGTAIIAPIAAVAAGRPYAMPAPLPDQSFAFMLRLHPRSHLVAALEAAGFAAEIAAGRTRPTGLAGSGSSGSGSAADPPFGAVLARWRRHATDEADADDVDMELGGPAIGSSLAPPLPLPWFVLLPQQWLVGVPNLVRPDVHGVLHTLPALSVYLHAHPAAILRPLAAASTAAVTAMEVDDSEGPEPAGAPQSTTLTDRWYPCGDGGGFVNWGLVKWQEQQARWSLRPVGYSVRHSALTFDLEDYIDELADLTREVELPGPVPLPDMIDMFTTVWSPVSDDEPDSDSDWG